MKCIKGAISILAIAILLLSCGKEAENVITGSGVIEATEVVVSSQANGQIVELPVKEGNAVRQDDIMGRVDNEKLLLQKQQLQAGLEEMEFRISSGKTQIASAQINYQNVKKQYERIAALMKDGSTTQQQLDNVEAQFKNAQNQLAGARNNLQASEMKKRQLEAQLKLLESQIADCEITAPLSGIIVEKYKQQGEFVGTGMPVVSIADLNNLWIKLYVAETDLGYVKLGSAASIAIDTFPDKKLEGKIIWISPKAEFTPHNVQTKEARTDLVYAVKIEVPNPDGVLKIGMPADILVEK